MKYSLIFAVVAGFITIINGWIADFASPAFRIPDTVATDVTEKIVNATETKNTNVVATSEAKVVRVIDGDTIEVEFSDGERSLVRYVGIDTPEREREGIKAECYYTESTKRNEELVGGQMVKLERDVSDTDQYGRLLRYVFVGDDLINLRLLKEGYGQVVSIEPDVSRVDLFRASEAEAKRAGLGLWGNCGT